MSDIVITNTMLPHSGKHGILKPDAHGYRTVVLGGFGICNESGIYYDPQSAVASLSTDSILTRKLNKGMLFGEADHPDITGLTEEQALRRLVEIRVQTKSHKIRKIRVVTDKYRDKNGQLFVAVEGDVAPSDNQYGRDLERDFNDPDQNTAFSIRSLLDTVRSTSRKRFIKIPITWDRVDEPGIAYANKYFSSACENFIPFEIDKFSCGNEVLMDVIEDIKKQGGTESVDDIMTLMNGAILKENIIPAFLR